jgi:hypothetical protein
MDIKRPWTTKLWMRGMVTAKTVKQIEHCLKHPKDWKSRKRLLTYTTFLKNHGKPLYYNIMTQKYSCGENKDAASKDFSPHLYRRLISEETEIYNNLLRRANKAGELL